MSYRGGRITCELYLSSRAEGISLMEASCVSQVTKVASFPLQPCKNSCWNVSYYRLLLTETEVTGCVLLITFLQKENNTGCLCSVKKDGKNTSLIFLFFTSDSLIIATFFPFSRLGLFWLCKCQAFSKNYPFHGIYMWPRVPVSVGNYLYYLYCRSTLVFMSETKSLSVMYCWTAVKMSLPWRFLT